MGRIFLKVFTVSLFVLMVLAPVARADRTEEAIEKAAHMNASVVRMHKEGRIEEALEAGERAYNAIAEMLGLKHPSTATSLHNLAALFQEMGELRRAETFFKRALKIREATLGARHRDTINSRRKLTAIQKILSGPTAAGEHKPSTKIIKNGGGRAAPVKTTAPTVRVAPVKPKIVDTKTIKTTGKPRAKISPRPTAPVKTTAPTVRVAPVKPKTVDTKTIKTTGKPRAKISPRPTATVTDSIGRGVGRAPASANGEREVKPSAKIIKNAPGGTSGTVKEINAEIVAVGEEEEHPALVTRSLPIVIAENGEESEPAMVKDAKFDEYKVKLGVDALMKIPGSVGVLRVWIGAPEYTPEFREGMSEVTGTLPKVGETARVKAFAPDFEIEPADSICIKLHPTGADALFELRPKKKGQFNVSAVVNLYESDDCSGAAIPRAVETLQVTVKVDTGKVAVEHAGEMWKVFWEKFLDFWGAIVALFFGLILFLLRGKLKKIFGFGGDKS
ncbi:Chemotaxis protein methyltransferase CheR [hydrothermal vent metagenome]|uniref:Chemotaxis protein methyltransferase CheR n=1 Tax=hydrothermal vent metagenome TaxID=652676 RepID=A0A3B0R769_9ZZZZ